MKNFLQMSKRMDAKRHQCEGAKLCSPITNKNEMTEGKQNEKYTTTNEESRDADS